MKKQTRWIAILMIMALLCCASCAQKDGAGKQAVVGEQVESSAEEKQPTVQTPSKPTEEQPQKPAKENDEQTEEPQKQESEQPSDSMVKRVETNDYSELVRITKDELGALFDYDIYYYQIENFYIDVDGKEVELRQALKNDPKVLDLLYAEWKKDYGTTYLYSDGGTVDYPYESYTAIKMNRIRVSISSEDYSIERNNADRSLILCSPKANLSEVDDRIMLGVTDYGYNSEEDQCYKSTAETEPFPPSFVLRKNGRFTFVFSHFSSFAPQGTYTIEGTKLTLQTQGEFDYRYVFKKAGDGWKFIAKESAEIPSFRHGENTEPVCPVPDGTIFEIAK